MCYDILIVVPLKGTLFHHMTFYFGKQCRYENMSEIVSWFPVLYVIFDGDHSNKDVLHLVSYKPAWVTLIWFVTILHVGHSVDGYVHMVWFQNYKHNSSFYIEMTFYDSFINCRLEYDILWIYKKKPTDFHVPNLYKHFNPNWKSKVSLLVQRLWYLWDAKSVKHTNYISNSC